MNSVILALSKKEIRSEIRHSLELQGCIVFESVSIARTKDILKNQNVDMILLDSVLSGESTAAYIPTIKKDKTLLWMLGENVSEKYILKAFEYGIDDFIDHIPSNKVLSVKIMTCFRSSLTKLAKDNSKNVIELIPKYKFHQWILEPSQCQLFDKDRNSANLTVQEYKLLETLIKNAGKTVKRCDLAAAMHNGYYTPSPRAIDVKIARIRHKIGDSGCLPNMILTIRGVGYLFNQKCLSDENT